jgi:anaerobic selenocysteine-containing dehydrogenase
MQADCSLRVYLQDGAITKIDGNPDIPSAGGRICSKSISSIMALLR